ncbi:TRAP C4-dicarboxylate transport system permease DctM subunit [Leptothrix cholodnii SP-6]|uniref:TRAP C4-dicarboxylate transport system permease DctM subunit n=1 Tax=Leptothrix cholodnii (strain ATCC 51168 / LMG 8142 / SP-6) TaxID=395495 RepID=B1Y4S5_LEPCP|nr:TRAP transporter large permease subunit [Leptothrix cholodnii]ACB34638.1 TRAP C4-dicarboxylate transport system permease DctM subunit [Leptothrix cholodnii SP-6]
MSAAVERSETFTLPDEVQATLARSRLMLPLEAAAAALMAAIMLMLLAGVGSRYLLSDPLVWVDEAVSIAFLWLAMLGSAIAIHRNEHLRLTVGLNALPVRLQGYVQAFGLMVTAVFLLALVQPAFEYVESEAFVTTPALEIPNSWRVAAIAFGIVAMLVVVLTHAWRTCTLAQLAVGTGAVAAVAGACWGGMPVLADLGHLNIVIFLIGFVAVCLVAAVPIAFCFGIGAVSFLAFTTHIPMGVMIGRMDEGMSSLVLVSVPVFVLLGCVLDATGMGRAIIDFLASLVGHVKGGMSYVLLGSLFIVSGISGSKVSDMATVAPALFPEMKRRGQKPKDMIALLSTGAAMADTVPPSIVLIVLGSVAGVSIAGLFQAGVTVALVLLLALAVLARWKARNEVLQQVRRAPLALVGRTLLIAGPALVLPFLIRGAVGGGVATATEVSTLAVVYAMLVGMVMYGGIGPRKIYAMLVETAALSGAVLMILGTALAMAWVITQSGVAQQLAVFMKTLPGGVFGFMAVTIVMFLILGCVLEGLPALLLMAPLMFPIARAMGVNDVHYAMVVVVAMNIGLMMPPIGVGFYIACRIGDVSPDEAMGAIWPYIAALIVGLIVIAAVPGISTAVL